MQWALYPIPAQHPQMIAWIILSWRYLLFEHHHQSPLFSFSSSSSSSLSSSSPCRPWALYVFALPFLVQHSHHEIYIEIICSSFLYFIDNSKATRAPFRRFFPNHSWGKPKQKQTNQNKTNQPKKQKQTNKQTNQKKPKTKTKRLFLS